VDFFYRTDLLEAAGVVVSDLAAVARLFSRQHFLLLGQLFSVVVEAHFERRPVRAWRSVRRRTIPLHHNLQPALTENNKKISSLLAL
jgi:hypothetical protein